MSRNTINTISRALAWVAVAFGLLVAGFGALISIADGGMDVGGVVGGAFILGGLYLVIEALPFGFSKKKIADDRQNFNLWLRTKLNREFLDDLYRRRKR